MSTNNGQIEWVKLFKRESEVLIVFQVPFGRKYYPEVIGISFLPRNLKHEDWFYYIDKKDLIQEFLTIKEEYEKNPLFLVKLANKIEKKGEELVRETREMTTHIKDKSDTELKNIFEKYNDTFCKYMPFVWVGFSVEKVLAEDIKMKLKEAYSDVSDKEIDEYFNILTSLPFRESTAMREQKKILETAALFQKEGKMTAVIKNRIRNLYTDFSWAGAMRVGWTYLKPAYDIDHYEGLINALSQGNPNKQLEQLLQKEKELKENYNKFIKEKKISPKIIEVTDLLRQYIFIRTYRGEVVVQAMVHARPLLYEIASRFNLKLEDIVYFTPNEILKLLESGEIPNYEERKQGYKLLIIDGKPEIIGGVKVTEIKFEEISELKGQGTVAGVVKGKVRVIHKKEDIENFRDGDVLVTQMTSPDMMPAIMRASAIITDEGGLTCHAALISRELRIPCIIGTELATKVFKDGDLVEINSKDGIVKKNKLKRAWDVYMKDNIEKMKKEKNINGLIDLLKYNDVNIRFNAADALGELKIEDTVEALINFLEGEYEHSKLWAMIAMGRLGFTTYYESLKNILVNSDNKLVIRRIAFILALTGTTEAIDLIKENIEKINRSLEQNIRVLKK